MTAPDAHQSALEPGRDDHAGMFEHAPDRLGLVNRPALGQRRAHQQVDELVGCEFRVEFAMIENIHVIYSCRHGAGGGAEVSPEAYPLTAGIARGYSCQRLGFPTQGGA